MQLQHFIIKTSGRCWLEMFEAARATSAAPTYFKPFRKDNNSYTDGGVGFNSPVELLYDKTFALLSANSKKNSVAINECPIAYIVRIGTGKMPDLPLPNPNAQRVFRLKNDIDSIIEQASDTENAHHRMENICRRLNIPYYRFNPELKERVGLPETASLDDLYEKTNDYMNRNVEQVNQLCALFSETTCSMLCKPCMFQKKILLNYYNKEQFRNITLGFALITIRIKEDILHQLHAKKSTDT